MPSTTSSSNTWRDVASAARAIIDSSSGNLAPDRFSLFWSYFDTGFTRERNKLTSCGSLLPDHKAQIDKVHEHVGY
jgi:hypothetical protein